MLSQEEINQLRGTLSILSYSGIIINWREEVNSYLSKFYLFPALLLTLFTQFGKIIGFLTCISKQIMNFNKNSDKNLSLLC